MPCPRPNRCPTPPTPPPATARATALGTAALVLALAALPAPAASGATPPSPGDERESLEQFLERVRGRRDALQAVLADRVLAILGELESLAGKKEARQVRRVRTQLLELGIEVAPLLVVSVDPGPDPSAGRKFRSRQVVAVLRELASPAITNRLLEMAVYGTDEGRRNALAVLATSPDPERVAPLVSQLYRTAEGRLRQAALETLAALGGPAASALLAEALADPDDEIVDLALRALAGGHPRSATLVLDLVLGDRGPDHVRALTDYYRVRSDLLEEGEHLLALLTLAANPEVQREAAVYLLDHLAELGVEPRSAAKRVMEPLARHVNDDLRESALVLLARARDKGAKRTLLRPYNDHIARQKDFDQLYTERGDVYYRIGDHSNAIKDYKQAIKLQDKGARSEEPYFGLARSYAAMKRYKDAEVYLNNAPVSVTRLRELAREPVFAAMLQTKFARAFSLPDQE